MSKSGIDLLKEKENILFPDYNHSILSTITSILKYYSVETPYVSLDLLDKKLEKNYKNVVLIVLDGMGKNILDSLPNNYFSNHLLDVVTSVYPSTTPAAMTTYYSGRPPIETAWIAWSQYMKEYGRYLDIFQKRDSYTGKVYNDTKKDLLEIIGYEQIYDRIENASQDVKVFEVSPSYVLKKAKRYLKADTVDEMVEHIKVLCSAEGRKFIFCYQDNPDVLLHIHGTKSEEVKNYLIETIAKVEEMTESLKDTLVIVTADHGHQDVEEEYDINDFETLKECFIMPPALESRCMTFWIKPKMREYFQEEFNKCFGHAYVLLTKEEFLENHFLGYGKEHKKVDDFLGDFVALSTSSSSIKITNDYYFGKMKKASTHCGLTKNEMLVPIITIEKE